MEINYSNRNQSRFSFFVNQKFFVLASRLLLFALCLT